MEASATIHNLFPDFDGEVTPDNLHKLMSRVAELERQLEEQRAELMKARTRRDADDLEDELQGHLATIRKQSRAIGALERKIKEDDDPSLTSNAAAKAVCERWKQATGKSKAVIGKSRIKMVNARAGDGYPYTSEDWLPDHITLELAVDGLASHPYRVYDKRFATGRKADLDNDLDACMKDEKHVERCARLGYAARKAGWTLEEGWPE